MIDDEVVPDDASLYSDDAISDEEDQLKKEFLQCSFCLIEL